MDGDVERAEFVPEVSAKHEETDQQHAIADGPDHRGPGANLGMQFVDIGTHERALLDQRRDAMVGLASNIAHEMRTPLGTLQSAIAGLGLPFCQRVMAAFGGTITAASSGQGATFTLSFAADQDASGPL